MKLVLDPNSIADYRTFLRVKQLPTYRIRGCEVEFPDEYSGELGLISDPNPLREYRPWGKLFDYQIAISRIAIRKRKFAAFARPGLGKTFMISEFVRHALASMPTTRKALIVSPIMVCSQTISEIQRFYGESLPVEYVPAADLQNWLDGGHGGRLGITNFEAIRTDITRGNLGCLAIDESSMMKSSYGTWAKRLISLGRGLRWKFCATGTPAPNDRIEYGNHAVFLDQFQNINAFLAKYFINRGQTDNRWELKPHALRPFYRDLSHWCIFLNNPATYGWKDNCDTIPPIHAHIHEVELTQDQRNAVSELTGQLCVTAPGGITQRNKFARIAKGTWKGKEIDTNKYGFIRDLVAGWPDESTLQWCWYDDEQERLEATFPGSASISGATKLGRRLELIQDFNGRERRVLISKPKILGFGLNLQVATRQVFSSLIDSYEAYYQCVCRSNRVGSSRPLNVHIPITEIEEPMVDTVLRKAKRVEEDTAEQEAIFKESAVLV